MLELKEVKQKKKNKKKPATEKRKERKKTGNVSRLLIHVTSISLSLSLLFKLGIIVKDLF